MYVIELKGSTACTDLHDEHVLSVRALLCQVTHVANQSSLSTACLTHDHNRNATPDEGGRKGGGGEEHRNIRDMLKHALVYSI